MCEPADTFNIDYGHLVPRRLYLARHGETEWNAIGRLQGHTDVPLNDRGRAQARDLAGAVRKLGIKTIIASDLARARDTAAIIASELDPPRARAGYHAALRPMLTELRVARTLARLLYEHPRARRWVFGRVGQRLVEAITDVFMGARTYRASVAGFVAALALRRSTRS